MMRSNGKGVFEAVLSGESGFRVQKDSRQVAIIKTADGDKLIVANNHDRLMLFDIN